MPSPALPPSKADSQNLILAIVLSVLVIVGWNYFYGQPQMERSRQEAAQAQGAQGQGTQGQAGAARPVPGAAPSAPAAPAPLATRAAALAASPRVAVETPRLAGSVNLRGARIDDLRLLGYRETTDPRSATITLLSPAGGPEGYFGEFGWVAPAGTNVPLPNADTLWTAEGGPLTPERPLTLTWDNGAGLLFRRVVAVDPVYLFTVTDTVENRGAVPLRLYPYGLVQRAGTPVVQGFYVLHEGLVGVLGDNGLQEVTYADAAKAGSRTWAGTGGFVGITDKYWAVSVVPDQARPFEGVFASDGGGGKATAASTYRTIARADALDVPAGGAATSTMRLFAGAKEFAAIEGYKDRPGIRQFDLLIDWGWFYFITKPLFIVMDWLFKLTGNFGVAILVVTVLLKLLFFPLANKSYESMARMKALQPKMKELQERYADDKVKQQQELMGLYKKEKINPIAGCWPVLLQIPVFFALYKVIFVTIEMRQAPFFGWIKDLAAPDPTSMFNLFGLLPYNVPEFLQIGAWPIIMGVTMWLQMKMNPEPTDPVQKMVFSYMPLIFTFMLGSFPVGLVIYWSWNNLLSVMQQGYIMKRQGVPLHLFDNLRATFRRGAAPAE